MNWFTTLLPTFAAVLKWLFVIKPKVPPGTGTFYHTMKPKKEQKEEVTWSRR